MAWTCKNILSHDRKEGVNRQNACGFRRSPAYNTFAAHFHGGREISLPNRQNIMEREQLRPEFGSEYRCGWTALFQHEPEGTGTGQGRLIRGNPIITPRG